MTSMPAPLSILVQMMRRLTSRAGVRLALVQAVVVIIAFLLAGCLAMFALEQISQASIRQHIAGEAASLDEEFIQKGAAHLPFTVAKRSRLWRGFDYRLVAPNGALLAGRLPAIDRTVGWNDMTVPSPDGPPRHYLAYTKIMPDGARLTVGEDLIVLAGEMDAITRSLLMCGGLGVLVCVTLSYLFARGTWRRIDALSATAHAVSSGRLGVRVARREGPPRDDVDELGHAFNGMLDRIGGLISQVRQVSTDIAHDLRSPLTRFGQKLERLRKVVGKNPELLTAVDGLESDLGEILRTFDALLQLSEIEASASAVKQKHADLGEIVARVAEAYRPDIEESGRALDVFVEPSIVEGDGDLLAQCVANLLENALRHTPKGSHIAVSGRPLGDRVELAVQDDGRGIPPEHRDRVIKPFVRLESERSGRGSGLGLAIVAAVAARHGATLSLEDAEPGLRVGLSFSGAASHRAPSRTESDLIQ